MDFTQKTVADLFADLQQNTRAPDLAYGVRVDGENVIDRHANQQFRIASMTKSFTAAAILMLRDHKLLSLDSPVANLVPELAPLQLPTSDSPAITVRDLLIMTSGLASDNFWGDRQMAISQEALSQLMTDGGYFAAAPGLQFVYSNYGYAILGRVVANVSGQSFRAFIETELLEPLGMSATSWEAQAPNFAVPYRLQGDEEVVEDPLDPLPDGAFAPMAGLWSTVTDLLRWAEFMMDAFPARNETEVGPLRRSSRREMQQIHRFDFGGRFAPRGVSRIRGSGYGMGLIVLDDPKLGHIVMHPGGLPGYGSAMAWLPERRTAVVGLANITYAHVWTTSFTALDALDDAGLVPQKMPLVVPLLEEFAQRLLDLFNDWDDDVARQLFAVNVELDLSFDQRRAALAKFGELTMEAITPNTAADCSATVFGSGVAQQFKLWFSLSPQTSPRIQAYRLTPADG